MAIRQWTLRMPTPEEAYRDGRSGRRLPRTSSSSARRCEAPFAGMQMALFGMGCFWGAERKFWTTKGVYPTAVGYAGGSTPNPTYREVCSERTGHVEAVRVVFDPQVVSYEALLKVFWENHKGMDCETCQQRIEIQILVPIRWIGENAIDGGCGNLLRQRPDIAS
jgi:Peptide methionine sulfoxide reductase